MSGPIYEVRREDTSALLIPTRGEWDEPELVADVVPRAKATIPDFTGAPGDDLTEGDEFAIIRDGTDVFPGILESLLRHGGTDGGTLTLNLAHRGYHALRAKDCDGYEYHDAGFPRIRVNPWRYFVFRDPNDPFNPDATSLDGVTRDKALRCFLGTRFVLQLDFQDARWFRPSQHFKANLTQDDIIVYWWNSPSATIRKRAGLRKMPRGESTYGNGNNPIETIPLMNGDPDVDEMGDVTGVTLTVIYVLDEATDVMTFEVCRNAGEGTRTYTTVTGSTTNLVVGGVTYKVFTGTVTFADSPAQKNQLGVRFKIDSPGLTTASNTILYAKVDAALTPETDVTEGTLDAYTDPDGVTDGQYVDDDFEGLDRLTAIERLRKSTQSTSANPGPHWDFWIDADLAAHFQNRRGAALATTFTATNGRLGIIERERYGDQLAYQTIGLGGGRGSRRLRLVDATAFTSGGLYDADRDPAGATRLYGDLPRVNVYRDQTVTSLHELRARARADHKLKRAPREFIRAQFHPQDDRDYETGDTATFQDDVAGVDGTLRFAKVSYAWTGDGGEEPLVTLGERLPRLAESRRDLARSTDGAAGATTPQGGELALTGTRLQFEKDDPVGLTFNVDEDVTRVLLAMLLTQYQTEAATGVTVFKGDTPGSAPLYCARVHFAVDLPLNAAGTPTTFPFSDTAHPIIFGRDDAPLFLVIDITGYLDVDADDRVTPGPHTAWFSGDTAGETNNAQSLGALQVLAITHREGRTD